MTEVIGATQKKMDDIHKKIFYAAEVVPGGQLVFTYFDIMLPPLTAGHVQGDVGPKGPAGPISASDVNTAISDTNPTAWTDISMETDWSSGTEMPEYINSSTHLSYRVFLDRVYLRGYVKYTGSSTSGDASLDMTVALGASYRPIYPIALGGVGNNAYFADLRMGTNGVISLHIPSGNTLNSTNGNFTFDGLSYPLS